MATQTDIPKLGADVVSLLARLRRRIRMYVWAEGLSLALLWLGATFWIGLAIDYLPVLMGASEMPRVPRLILLAIDRGRSWPTCCTGGCFSGHLPVCPIRAWRSCWNDVSGVSATDS